MTTAMTITLLIIAAASIALNVFQWMERKIERKETNKMIADSARLEDSYHKLEKVYNNERLHKDWAIGRIKDQQAVIDQLRSIAESRRPRNYKK